MYETECYRVMIASPFGDTKPIREGIMKRLERFNVRESHDKGYVLVPWTFETAKEVTMDVGDAQETLNARLVASCDVLVSFMKQRFGTPTPRYPSGTIEEIEEFRKRKTVAPALFFYAGQIDQHNFDEVTKIKEYKAQCEKPDSKILYGSFTDDAELVADAMDEIHRQVRELRNAKKSFTKPAPKADPGPGMAIVEQAAAKASPTATGGQASKAEISELLDKVLVGTGDLEANARQLGVSADGSAPTPVRGGRNPRQPQPKSQKNFPPSSGGLPTNGDTEGSNRNPRYGFREGSGTAAKSSISAAREDAARHLSNKARATQDRKTAIEAEGSANAPRLKAMTPHFGLGLVVTPDDDGWSLFNFSPKPVSVAWVKVSVQPVSVSKPRLFVSIKQGVATLIPPKGGIFLPCPVDYRDVIDSGEAEVVIEGTGGGERTVRLKAENPNADKNDEVARSLKGRAKKRLSERTKDSESAGENRPNIQSIFSYSLDPLKTGWTLEAISPIRVHVIEWEAGIESIDGTRNVLAADNTGFIMRPGKALQVECRSTLQYEAENGYIAIAYEIDGDEYEGQIRLREGRGDGWELI